MVRSVWGAADLWLPTITLGTVCLFIGAPTGVWLTLVLLGAGILVLAWWLR